MFARLPAQALCPRGQACWSKRGPRALSSCGPLAEALGHGLGGHGSSTQTQPQAQAALSLITSSCCSLTYLCPGPRASEFFSLIMPPQIRAVLAWGAGGLEHSLGSWAQQGDRRESSRSGADLSALPRLKIGVQASHSPSVSFSGPPTSQGGWSPAHSFPGPGAQSAGHTGHSQGQVSTHITTTPSFPLRALPGTQTRLQSLFFLLPDGVSSSQPCWYRSTSASFQFTFNENCSSYRCIFDGFVG